MNTVLANAVLSDVKSRLAGHVATGHLSLDDMRDLLTFLDMQLERWVRAGGR